MQKTILKAATGVAFLLSSHAALAEVVPVNPETVKTAVMLRDAALKDDTAYSLVEELTTEFGPRLAGSPSEIASTEWAEAKLKALGFDKVWREPVTVRYWERISESARIVGPFPQPLSVTSLGKAVSTPEGGVTAEIAQFDTLDALKAADPAKVKGKIVFISNRMDRTQDGSGYGPAVQARGVGMNEASAKGAVALLIRSIGTDDHRNPHTGGIRTYAEGQAKIAAAALSNPDADQLMRVLKRGKPVTVHLDIQTKDHGDVTTYNVIGELTGREQPDQIVAIGSHIDSWDLATGAIDDGAGVALNMATAKLIIGLAPERPRKTIRVILFASEEPGLVGARAYMEAHKDEIANHAIEAESDFGADRIWALASNVAPSSLHVIDTMAGVMGPLGVIRESRKADGGSDMSLMAKAGIPAVDLMQDGTHYFDLHHTPDDTLDKIDPEALKQNLAAWAVFTYISAEWPGSFR